MRAASLGVALAGAFAAAGCSTTTAVDLTIVLGGDVAAHVSELNRLDLHVDGDKTPFDQRIDVRGKFGSGRETLQYLPGVRSGMLTFTITLSDGDGRSLGGGRAAIAIVANRAVALTIPLGTDVDLGMLPSADLAPPPDMAPPCASIQVSTLAGTGAAGYTDGPPDMAQFTNAEGITVDSSGTLYVAEFAHLRKVLADGTTSTLGTGYLQAHRVSCNLLSDCYVADSANDTLWRVTSSGTSSNSFFLGGIISVATSRSTLGKNYVWDTQTAGIQVTNSSNMPVPFSGGPSAGFFDGSATTSRFQYVPDMVFDSAGILWVVDTGNFRVRRVAADGSVTTIAGSATQGRVDGTGAAAQFDTLNGIAIDEPQQLLYVTDGPTIRRVTQAGVVTTIVGSTSGFIDGTGCVAKFGALKGITFFAGSLYVVDVERIRKVTLP
jgi:hypothetical protein